ncbi:MAG: UDP-N-acetylmuramate--L-alanine ligase [Candidatus Omnitrophota bacterium]
MSKHYHLIGIGGIGMSGIARLLLHRGVKVSGSDLKETRITKELSQLGISIFIGHSPDNIRGADVVIYTSAVKEDNSEFIQAKKTGVVLIRRALALAQLMKDKTVITVSGSHGKTTTSSLAAYLLLEAGLKPSIAVGGIFKNIDTNACLGEGDYFVAEADESDGSFFCYQPDYSIITNIDREHLDYYRDFDSEIKAFKEFIYQTKPNGCVFACGDDLNLKAILKYCPVRSVLFGLNKGPGFYPDNIELDGLTSSFDCFYQNKYMDRFNLSLGGKHNISNSLAVIALGLELKIGINLIKKALLGYKGAGRRLEQKLKDSRYLILDDYAHHPTEIKATLDALKNIKYNRLFAIFQPHRFSRTQLLLDEFGRSFDAADKVIITDIYPASEQPIPGITGKSIYEKIKEYHPDKDVVFLAKEDIIDYVLKAIQPQDLIITLGAGDITRISDELAQRLSR